MDMFIKKSEVKEWFSEEPHSEKAVFKAYKETITDILNDLLIDPRSAPNSYIVNQDFSTTPKYLAAFTSDQDNHLVLSVLYVFPEYRNRGYGTHLIQQLQQLVNDSGVIQVAVDDVEIQRLNSFYVNLGFKPTGEIIPNVFGKKYQDYFWSGREIEIKRLSSGHFAVRPL